MKTLLATLPRWKAGDHLFSTTDGRKPVAGFADSAKTRLDREMARTWRALGRVRGYRPARRDTGELDRA